MKRLYLMLSALSVLTVLGCGSEKTVSIEYVPTPGETAAFVYTPGVDSECKVLNRETHELEPFVNSGDAQYPIRHSVEIFPKEIYFGDTVYVVATDENVSSETLKSTTDFSDTSINKNSCAHLANSIKEYTWIPEFQTKAYHCRGLSQNLDLLPGKKILQKRFYMEFPPLEDKETLIWKELENSIPPEGTLLSLRISSALHNLQNGSFIFVDTTVDILVKPRPETEKALLDAWYQNTPEKTFPEVDGNRKIPNEMDLHANKKSWIKIGWHSYDPWLFVRIGNRKPCDPNNPTTLDGWRKLEASLTPSTMRDEVRLVRLQLEYYSAEPGVKSDLAKKELVQWIKSLPTPQRAVYFAFLQSKQNSFRHNAPALSKKNYELLDALYDESPVSKTP